MLSVSQEKFLLNKKILLGIEQKPIRDIIVNMCKENGCTSIVFGNGDEMILLAEKVAPDIVYCEFNMAPLDGISFTRAIRPKIKSSTPIIMLISDLDHDGSAKARQAGASESVRIPFSLNDIVSVTKKVLARGNETSPSGLRFGPR